MDAKAAWKKYYRILRITRRECMKAQMDMMIYGSGYVRINKTGYPLYVPAKDILFHSD